MPTPLPRSSQRVARRLMRLYKDCGTWSYVALEVKELSGKAFDRTYLHHVANGKQRASRELRAALGYEESQSRRPSLRARRKALWRLAAWRAVCAEARHA